MIGCAGGTGAMKDSDKLKLMLLAWNYHNNQGKHRFHTHTLTQLFTYYLINICVNTVTICINFIQIFI